MALEDFDYFIWEDEEPVVIQKAEDDTDVTIKDGPIDTDDKSTDTTSEETKNDETTTTTDGSNTKTNDTSSSSSTTADTTTTTTETSTNSTAPEIVTARKGKKLLYELEDTWVVAF